MAILTVGLRGHRQHHIEAGEFGAALRVMRRDLHQRIGVDDAGIVNAYPLMKVAAHDAQSSTELASLDVVLPVASEANCQNCHADVNNAGNGAASNFASVSFDIVTASAAPGPKRC